MGQEIKLNSNEIIARLAKLESDMEYIKRKLKLERNLALKAEMEAWEQASEEDVVNWERENL